MPEIFRAILLFFLPDPFPGNDERCLHSLHGYDAAAVIYSFCELFYRWFVSACSMALKSGSSPVNSLYPPAAWWRSQSSPLM